MNRHTREEMFDLMLRDAFREDLQKEEPVLSAREEPPVSFSPAFQRKMAKLIRKAQRAEWWQRNRGRVQRTAAMFAVVIMIGGLLVTKVDAFRVPFLELMYTVRDEFTEIDVKEPNHEHYAEGAFDDYLPAYVPDGYYLDSMEEYEDFFEYTYTNGEEGHYSVSFYESAQDSTVDTEDAVATKKTVKGFPGFISEKDGRTIFLWYPNEHQYIIVGTLPVEEILRMIDSIEKTF